MASIDQLCNDFRIKREDLNPYFQRLELFFRLMPEQRDLLAVFSYIVDQLEMEQMLFGHPWNLPRCVLTHSEGVSGLDFVHDPGAVDHLRSCAKCVSSPFTSIYMLYAAAQQDHYRKSE
jgi:hypothetical protein